LWSLVLKVTTDDGQVGWGEAFGFVGNPSVSAVIQHIVAPVCLESRADTIEPLMQDLQQRFHIFGRSGAIIYALSALDIALWDLKAPALDTAQQMHTINPHWLEEPVWPPRTTRAWPWCARTAASP
jgi:L-alanine-DL-glutamate epimerase-like enolase superfamily enzyme